MSQPGAYTAKILLLVLGCVLAFGLGEALLRLTGLGTPSVMIPHGALPFKKRPSIEFLNRKENENLVVLNGWGFHDVDRRSRKEGYRFVAFGDSFVEGNQVPVDQLFTSLIEQRLRREMPGAEVVNAGVGGVGTAYEYLLYKEFFAGEIELDHVLLFFMNGNDLPNNHPLLERAVNGNSVAGKVYVDAQGREYVIEAERSLLQRILSFLDRHSALSYTVHKALYQLRRERSRRRSVETSHDEARAPRAEDPDLAQAWEEAIRGTSRLIERWADELGEQGIGFSIVIIPSADHYLLGDYGSPYKARMAKVLRCLGEEKELSVLELDFSAHDPYDIYSFDRQTLGHFNVRGHEITATQVAAWLLADS